MARPRTVEDGAILQAARACFLERGPTATTAEIARRVGLTQPALFKRFGSKEALLRAALVPRRAEWPPALERGVVDARDVRAQLVEIAEELHAFFERVIPAAAVLRASGLAVEPSAAGGVAPPVHSQRALVAWLDRAVRAGRLRRCDTAAAANALLGALLVGPVLAHLGGEVGTSRRERGYPKSIVDLLWPALAPARSKPRAARRRGR